MADSTASVALSLALSAVLVAGCSESTLSYQADVQPILEKNCSECHRAGGEGQVASGFATDSYQGLMKGTKFGPVIDPGSAISSSLYLLVAGKTDSSIRMPHGRSPLSDEEVAAIEKWIDQGAKDN
jgi:cytochrome c553